MEIEFLGTGAGVPAKHRNVSSLALKLLDEINEVWLFDCGEATQQQILHTSIRPRKVSKIFITHLHGDHIFGLPGFLSSRSFQGGEEPLTIYGPKGIKEFVETSLRVSESKLSYPLYFEELSTGGDLFNDEKFIVSCLPLEHRITCFGYRVVEKDHQGELNIARLKEEKIPPGPIYKRIKDGETVTLEDGRMIDGSEYVGESRKGRIITILGDTRQTDSIPKLCKNADVMVHESTFMDIERKMARAYFHSTSCQAAKVAKEQNVKLLLLTHISARYLAKDSYALEKEAKEIFPNSRVVKDFDVISIPFPKKG